MSGTVSAHPAVRLSLDHPSRIDVDLLVVPVFEAESAAVSIPSLDDAASGEVTRAAQAGEVTGRPYDFFMTPLVNGGWRAHRVALVGAGKAAEFSTERLRKVATAAAL